MDLKKAFHMHEKKYTYGTYGNNPKYIFSSHDGKQFGMYNDVEKGLLYIDVGVNQVCIYCLSVSNLKIGNNSPSFEYVYNVEGESKCKNPEGIGLGVCIKDTSLDLSVFKGIRDNGKYSYFNYYKVVL